MTRLEWAILIVVYYGLVLSYCTSLFYELVDDDGRPQIIGRLLFGCMVLVGGAGFFPIVMLSKIVSAIFDLFADDEDDDHHDDY